VPRYFGVFEEAFALFEASLFFSSSTAVSCFFGLVFGVRGGRFFLS
jgi:hypothetical protein